jgi:UDP-glucose 4-epimerase
VNDVAYVIGAGGLLGQSVVRHVPTDNLFLGSRVPWRRTDEATEVLGANIMRYAQAAGARWTVIWCAGAAVVATDEAAAAAELAQFRVAAAHIRRFLPAGRGVFFLTSSAGGIYAGSAGVPFDEESPPAPVSPYGRLKLSMELAALDELQGHCHVVIGRFSNIYGAGQDLSKQQGLISQLCLHALTRRALNVYVPLETIRDYLYVDDAAALVLSAVERAHRHPAESSSLRVMASGEPATVARLVGLTDRLSHHRSLIAVGVHPSSAFQVRDLRFRSRHQDEQRGLVRTGLTVGVAQVFRHTARLLGDGALS